MDTKGPWSPEAIPDVVLLVGPVQQYRDNLHDNFKLVQVDGSAYTIRRRGATHRAEPGELIVLHPGTAHSGTPDDTSGVWRIVCVPAELVAEVTDPDRLRFDPPVLRDPRPARQFRDVFQLFEVETSTLERQTALLELVVTLLESSDPGGWREPESDRAAETAELANAVYEQLSANLTRNIALEELAESIGASRFGVVRICQAHFGASPHKLHLRLRIDHASELIRAGMALADVAAATGFHDQAHFTRTFGRVYGMTPTQYRDSWNDSIGPIRKVVFRP